MRLVLLFAITIASAELFGQGVGVQYQQRAPNTPNVDAAMYTARKDAERQDYIDSQTKEITDSFSKELVMNRIVNMDIPNTDKKVLMDFAVEQFKSYDKKTQEKWEYIFSPEASKFRSDINNILTYAKIGHIPDSIRGESPTDEVEIPRRGNIDPTGLFDMINEYRASKGIPKLVYREETQGETDEWAKQQVRYLKHPDNPTFYENCVGEETSIEESLQAWKDSPGHNRNLLEKKIKYGTVSIYKVKLSTYSKYYCVFRGYIK